MHAHIRLLNLDIHHVNAKLGRGAGRDKGKNNGGICIDVFGDTVAGTVFDDVLIEGCYIYECGGTAIKTWSDQFEWNCHTPTTYHTNIVVRNNVVDHIQGDGIVMSMTEGATVEYNVASWTHMRQTDPYVAIWNYESDDTVMQFNEVYKTNHTTDGQAFDIDDYTERTTVQYKYSHDNLGGFILIIGLANARNKCGTCDNNVVRYNISQDDGEEITKFAGMSVHTDFYNNVFYHSGAAGAPPVEDVLRLSDSEDAHVYNNIFETWCGGNFLQPDFGVKQGFDFRRNIVYGDSDYSKWVDDYPDNLWGVDPQLVAPGTGGTGRDTCGGYMLQGTSPAIDYGLWSDDPILMALPSHPGPIGADHGSQDYFGNALPYPSGTPDAGAHEYAGGPPPPPVADFSGNPRTGNAPLTVYFTDLSTGNPTSWDWTFGDGGTSEVQNPVYEYQTADSYTVSLTVENAQGQDTETKLDYITVTEGQPPVADFVGEPTSGVAPLTVQFTDLSTNDPTSWSWTFGDGGTSEDQNPSYQYQNEGIYTVSLTATNAYGSDDEIKTGYITVTSGGGGDYYPASFTLEYGTLVAGGVPELQASDDTYMQVASAKAVGKQSTWIHYSFETGLSSLSGLTITSESHPSLAPQRERIRVWDFSAEAWTGVVGDNWLNTTSDQTTVTVVPSPADYISPTGEVRIRIRTGDAGGDVWDHFIDLVKITAQP
ncbi:MAG: PKD domain-containing protein [Armatimonadota bacterium]|nr:MAG: PKD domain-containing protein [Armatimonadota bacterium]